MHLLHLSTGRADRVQREAGPESSVPPPTGIGQVPQRYASVLATSSFAQGLSPEGSNEVIMTAGNPPHKEYKEVAQLPTPETSLGHSSSQDNFRSYPGGDMEQADQGHAKAPFSDFLRDVLYDQSFGGSSGPLVEAQWPAVLDFYDDTNLDLEELDFGLLNDWTFGASRECTADQNACPEDPVGMTAMRAALVKIWTESPWRWTPQKTDSAYTEHSNLPLPSNEAHGAPLQGNAAAVDRVCNDTLHAACRDKILATVLGTCRDRSTADRVTSSFPSTDAMDSWINIFLAAHLCQVSSWIHYGSFSLNSQCPEWLAMAAAAGAVLTPVPSFRRFGFALQEAVRKCSVTAWVRWLRG